MAMCAPCRSISWKKSHGPCVPSHAVHFANSSFGIMRIRSFAFGNFFANASTFIGKLDQWTPVSSGSHQSYKNLAQREYVFPVPGAPVVEITVALYFCM